MADDSPRPPSPPTRHVLVVDDESVLRLLLQEALEDEGYRVTTARDGAEALLCIQHEAPDLVLLDLMMPVLDGWSFLLRRRGEPSLRAIPVAVFSAVADPALTSLGVQAILGKPLGVDELLRTVADLTGGPWVVGRVPTERHPEMPQMQADG